MLPYRRGLRPPPSPRRPSVLQALAPSHLGVRARVYLHPRLRRPMDQVDNDPFDNASFWLQVEAAAKPAITLV